MQSPVIKRAGWFTWLILGLCVIFTLMTRAGQDRAILHWLFDFTLIQQGQVWRLITPIFLHFSIFGSPIVHLLFNGLWWLVVAGAIEKIEGSGRLILITLLSAVISNFAAYWVYGPFFGGLSGVCYGIIGYVWLRGRENLFFRQVVNNQLFIVFIVFLLVSYTGLFGKVANMAHLAGLIVGIALAAFFNLLNSKLKNNI